MKVKIKKAKNGWIVLATGYCSPLKEPYTNEPVVFADWDKLIAFLEDMLAIEEL